MCIRDCGDCFFFIYEFVLLKMLDYIRQFFKDFPRCNWLEFHIDENIVCSYLFPEGNVFNYGLLRKITKNDLEKEVLVC